MTTKERRLQARVDELQMGIAGMKHIIRTQRKFIEAIKRELTLALSKRVSAIARKAKRC